LGILISRDLVFLFLIDQSINENLQILSTDVWISFRQAAIGGYGELRGCWESRSMQETKNHFPKET
jgi:hypothetical protein